MSSSDPNFKTYQRAVQALMRGDKKKTAALCKEILTNDPNHALAHYLSAKLLALSGDGDKALLFTRMAISHNPNIAEFYVYLAELLFLKKDYAQAEIAAQKALSITPDDLPALKQLFAAMQMLGKNKEAQPVLLRLIEKQPNDPKLKKAKAALKAAIAENSTDA